jgi:hypothetical protein
VKIGSSVYFNGSIKELAEIRVSDDVRNIVGEVKTVFPHGWANVLFKVKQPMVIGGVAEVDYDIPLRLLTERI